jgi:hypothetical protein
MAYGQNGQEQDSCGKCGGLLRVQTLSKEDAEGYKNVRMRCAACGDKTTQKFDAHLGCHNWPNCDMFGCGND